MNKIKMFGNVLAVVAAAFTSTAFAEGKVFWWKGADWGRFDDPANWDVGAVGNVNTDNLVPGAEDAIAHDDDAKIDLSGGTFTVKRRATDFTCAADDKDFAINFTLHLTNGTLVVTEHHSAKLNIDVWNGATYRFEGSMYTDAHNINARAVQNIHSGGRIEITGALLRFFGMTMTIDEGGVLHLDPAQMACWPNIKVDVPIYNNGTIEAPDGMVLASLGWAGTQRVDLGVPCIYQNGILKLGGDVGRSSDYAGIKYLGLTISGGKVEVENSVSMINMPERLPEIAADANVVFDVKDGGVFDISGMSIGTGVSLTKTGAGDLKIGDAIPASLAVESGRVVLTETVVMQGLSFEPGSSIHVDAELIRIDECDSFANTVFSVDEALLKMGSKVLLSADSDILAHAKEGVDAQLKAAGLQAQGCIEGDALIIRSAYPYSFDAALSSDLADPGAWHLGSVPSADTAVRIKGAGIVNYNASSVKFASITVEEGATLCVSGGTAESPVDMPPVELNYESRLLLAEGSFVQITNTFTCLCNAEILPVFEIATNATAIVQTPDIREIRSPFAIYTTGLDYGFRMKNVALKWYGNIQTYHGDTGNRLEFCRLLLGWADPGETSYIAIDCRGGRYIAAGEANMSQRCRTPLAIAAPLPGGTVIPVGTLYFRDYACEQRKSAAEYPDYYVPGLFIGRWNKMTGNNSVAGNPESVKFDVLFEGEADVNLNGIFRIGGGAHVILNGPQVQWRYSRKAWNDDTLPRSLVLCDAGSIELKNGAYLGVCSTDSESSWDYPDLRGFIADGTQDGQKTFAANNSRMSVLNWYGSGNSVAEVSDSLLQIGYLRSANTLGNITGVFDGFKSVAIENTFTIAAADVDRGNSGKDAVKAVENWNRSVFVVPPLIGTGSLAVSNMLVDAHSVYSMTVTITNGANTASGRAFSAKTESGAKAALVFADGANWAGEVIAGGNVSLTNLVDAGAAANVSFGAIRLDEDFPIRVWKNGGVVTANDRINLSSAPAGTRSFVLKAMDEALEVGDKIEIGLYPADVEPPKDTRRLRYSVEPAETEGLVKLMAVVSRRGMTITVR